VSNPYLSQIERGLHEPSVRVLKAIATALNVSAETLLHQAGLLDDQATEASGNETPGADVEAAVAADGRLSDEQKQALLGVYRSYLAANVTAAGTPDATKPRTRGGRARGS
jgi:transcriptional regulator with XRE-family HTH domain